MELPLLEIYNAVLKKKILHIFTTSKGVICSYFAKYFNSVSVNINTTSAVQRDIISDYLEVLEINEISINKESAVRL